jgi:uncharacterized protein (UPF0332 family)
VNTAQKDLIRNRLARAVETLEQAKIMFQTGHPSGAINRLYYACFYAVNALLLSCDKSSAKHSGVISIFNKDFIKPGIFPPDMGQFYTDLFDSRQDVDYSDIVDISEQQIRQLLPQTQAFIDSIIEYLQPKLEND